MKEIKEEKLTGWGQWITQYGIRQFNTPYGEFISSESNDVNYGYSAMVGVMPELRAWDRMLLS